MQKIIFIKNFLLMDKHLMNPLGCFNTVIGRIFAVSTAAVSCWTPSTAVTPWDVKQLFIHHPSRDEIEDDWQFHGINFWIQTFFFFWTKPQSTSKSCSKQPGLKSKRSNFCIIRSDRLAVARLRVRQLLAKTSTSRSLRARVTCWGVRLTAGDWKKKITINI